MPILSVAPMCTTIARKMEEYYFIAVILRLQNDLFSH